MGSAIYNICADIGYLYRTQALLSLIAHLFLDNIDIFLFYLVTEKKAITGY